MPRTQGQLSDIIAREIAAAGSISSARFMQLALYHPIHGYYRRPSKQIGCQGDFYTSVSVGPLFGRLLAFQFAGWLDALQAATPELPSPGGARSIDFELVEAGAHDGRLAFDILSWFREHRPDLFDRLEYWILEPWPDGRRAQASLLDPFRPSVHWFTEWERCHKEVEGVIFANELLDAFPVFRLGWDAPQRRWFEWRVEGGSGQFRWKRERRMVSPELMTWFDRSFVSRLPAALLDVLPDGYTIENCPAAAEWWSEAAGRLRCGKLVTFDYGFEWEEFLAPERSDGTLRGYRGHRQVCDPLLDPGEQDLTAHVNFCALKEIGSEAGLATESFCSQGVYLSRVAGEVLQDLARFGSWNQEESRQFQTLVHPGHLGQSFRVLQQTRSPGG